MNSIRIILLAAAFVGSINVAMAQNFNGQKVTLHNYMFALTDEFQLYIEDLVRENIRSLKPFSSARMDQEPTRCWWVREELAAKHRLFNLDTENVGRATSTWTAPVS